MIDETHHRGRAWSYVRHLDWDADGREEVEVELPDQSWVVDPAEGGSLLYFDDKPSRWSIGDVVARRYEPYHAELPEPQTYDRHTRRWLIDHLLPSTTTVESFGGDAYRELAPLPDSMYVIEETTEGRGSVQIGMSALDGMIRKLIEAEERLLQIRYHLSGLPEGRSRWPATGSGSDTPASRRTCWLPSGSREPCSAHPSGRWYEGTKASPRFCRVLCSGHTGQRTVPDTTR